MARSLSEKFKLRFTLLAAMPLLALAALPGCKQARQEAEAPKAPTTETAAPSPVETRPAVAIEPLGRRQILAAAAAAADAVAAGRPPPQSSLELTNQNFELRLPFGCTSDMVYRWAEWSFDPKTRVLRISVKPQRWAPDSKVATLANGMPFEVAEGFWIDRAWTSSEDCPPSIVAPSSSPGIDASESPAPLPEPNIAIAQFFGPDTPRTSQRGNRPYTYTGRQDDNVPSQAGFRLKLRGRISGYADGQPFHCVVVDPSAPPLCVMAVQITGVALELPGARKALAEWTY